MPLLRRLVGRGSSCLETRKSFQTKNLQVFGSVGFLFFWGDVCAAARALVSGAGCSPRRASNFLLAPKSHQKSLFNTHDRTHFAPEARRSGNYRESDQKLGRALLHSAMQQRRRKSRDETILVVARVESNRIKSFIEFVTVLMHRHLAKSRDERARATRSAVTHLLFNL